MITLAQKPEELKAHARVAETCDRHRRAPYLRMAAVALADGTIEKLGVKPPPELSFKVCRESLIPSAPLRRQRMSA